MRMVASDSIASVRVPWRGLLIAAFAALAIHFLTAPRYGYFRDELYILACGRHLDWGYVDHAPLVGLVARLTTATLGDSLYALRFVTGLSAAAKVILTGLLARELGGNRSTQVFAAFSILFVPVYLVIDNQFSLNTGDPLFWMGTVFAILVALRKNRPVLLLWAGVLTGLGLENKHSTIFFLAALFVGLLLTPARRLLREPYFYGAVGMAFLIFLPNLIWQIAHGFPTLQFLNNVNASHKNVELPPAKFLLAQVLAMGPVNLLLWLPGLYFTMKSPRYRFLGVTYLVLVPIFMILHGKDYYLVPIYPVFLAAGAVFWSSVRYRNWVRFVVFLATIPLYPVGLPLLPPARIAPYLSALGIAPGKTETNQDGSLPQYFGDQFGWPELAHAASATFHSLPAEEQAHAAIYTGNYGEAGALEHYGVPRVISAHNTYWYWGRNSNASTLVLVGSDRLIREGLCTEVKDGPVIDSRFGVREEHFRIHICRGLKQPLPELWPKLKHWQ